MLGGVALALSFIRGDNILCDSVTELATLFAEVRDETPSIQEDLVSSHLVEELVNCYWDGELHYGELIPVLTTLAWDSVPTCKLIMEARAFPYIVENFENPDFVAGGVELIRALAMTDQDSWQGLCDAGAIPKLTGVLGGMVEGSSEHAEVAAALHALNVPVF